MGENSGVFDGVSSRLTLGFSLTKSIMSDDLWALINNKNKQEFTKDYPE